MATLSLSLVTGVNTYTKTVTLSDADALRLRDAMRIVYNLPGGTTAVVFDAYANGIFNFSRSTVLDTERRVQQPVIADIPMT